MPQILFVVNRNKINRNKVVAPPGDHDEPGTVYSEVATLIAISISQF